MAKYRPSIVVQSCSVAVLMLLAGCSQGGVHEETTGQARQQVETAATPQSSEDLATSAPEGAGTPAIVVGWNNGKTAVERVKELNATVINTTPEEKLVELTVLGMDPSGQTTERSLEKVPVGAKGSRTVSIPISDLPVQTTGLSSGMQLVAKYETNTAVGAPVVGGSRLRQSQTPALHVTFDADWQTATLRSDNEQTRVDTVVAKSGASPSVMVRRFEASLKTISTPSRLDSGETPIVLVTQATPAEVASAKADMAQGSIK